MILKSMTASFGRLRNARLALGEGLNLITLPNEGGKSTWCAFLRAMFYGISTRERDRQGYIAEKNRYQPWDGGAMEGEIELIWQGKEITIRRGPKGSTPFGSFSAVYTGTGESIPGLTGENCGETLLGVSREVYERSAFVGQGGAAIGSDAELERRIAALVSSGEEDVSFTEVEGKLKEWLRYRRFNKSGLIPKLENELAVVNDSLARQERSRTQSGEARRDVEALTHRRDALSAALAAYKQAENRDKYEKYRAAQTALEAAQNEMEAVRAQAARTPDAETLRKAQGDLAYYNTLEANRRLAESQIAPAQEEADELSDRAEDPRFPGLTPDEAWQQANRDRDRAAAKPKRDALFYLPIAALALAAVWFGVLIFFILQGGEIQSWMYWILVVVGALIITANSVNAKKKLRWQIETDELLEKYGVQLPDDILTQANTYRERYVDAQEAQRKLEAVRQSAADLTRQKEALLKSLLDTAHTFEPGVTDLFGVSAALSKGLSVREKLTAAQVRLEGARTLADSLPKPVAVKDGTGRADPDFSSPSRAGDPAEAEGTAAVSPEHLAAELAAVESELSRRKGDLALATGELNTLGDSVLFESRQEELQEELKRRAEEYAALDTALDALKAANATLQARFSPALNASAGEILSALTGGKYEKISLSRQFEAEAQEVGSALPRSTLSLSQGTAEQVYLAVRLAVCGMALPGDDPAPLVLDDALDAFDDTRMALALDYLLELGRKQQILLFSCHGRESAYLAGKAATLAIPTM